MKLLNWLFCQEAAEEAVGIPTGVKVAAAVVGGGCGYPGYPRGFWVSLERFWVSMVVNPTINIINIHKLSPWDPFLWVVSTICSHSSTLLRWRWILQYIPADSDEFHRGMFTGPGCCWPSTICSWDSARSRRGCLRKKTRTTKIPAHRIPEMNRK